MNLINKLTNKELGLLNNIGIKIKDRDYEVNEIRKYERQIEDFIFSHSSKNGDIARFSNEYSDILNTMIKCQ